MVRAAPTVLQVYLFRSSEFLGTDLFAERKIVIGRDPDLADLVLESSQVSRRHAVIEHDGQTVKVVDLDSTNGILINGQQTKAGEISRLDDLTVGEFTLKLKLVRGGRDAAVMDEEGTSPEPPRTDGGGRTIVQPLAAMPRGEPAVLRREPSDMRREAVDVRREPSDMRREAVDMRREPSEPSDQGFQRGEPKVPSKQKREEPRPVAPVVAQPMLSDVKSAPKPVKPAKPAPAPRFVEPVVDRIPSSLPPLSVSDDDDDDEEHGDEAPAPFSLRKMLESSGGSSRHASEEPPVIQVITLRGDHVDQAELVHPGNDFWIGPAVSAWRRRKMGELSSRVRLISVSGGGDVVAEVPEHAKGQLYSRGRELHLPGALAEFSVHPRRRTAKVPLAPGDRLTIRSLAHTHDVHFVYPLPRVKSNLTLWQRVRPGPLEGRSMTSSAIAHVAVAVFVTVLAPAHSRPPPTAEEAFVEVQMDKKMELTEKPPEAVQAPTKEPMMQNVSSAMEAAPSKQKKSRAGGTSKAPPGILGLLSKHGSSAAPGPAVAVAAASNLMAATAPGGTEGFRVSGLMGRMPTSSLSLGGGGGGIMTKGAAALLRGGGGGGGLVAGGQGTNAVGGLVMKGPRSMHAAGEGSLDRDLIQKVINENINQIQRCYERALVNKPGLSGKVQVEWVIALSGSVSSARQAFSNLESAEVVNCILSSIRSWRFPQPKGGDVIVNYPFMFKSIGF